MDELLEQFLIEGRDLVAQAARDFSQLAEDPADATAINSAFRAIHTLKGSVGLFEMAPAQRVLHAAEDILERARKRSLTLDVATVTSLTSCLDHVDRWIDEIEDKGRLSDDAGETAARAIQALSSLEGMPEVQQIAASAPESWVRALEECEAAIISSAAAGLTAFRYLPDEDCFFRGDDPLAIVAAVPDLLSLTVHPLADGWPSVDTIEPFKCFTTYEGLSAAPLDDVKAAFRLVSDQVTFAAIDPETAGTSDPSATGADRATGNLRVQAARIDAIADGLGELIVAINAIAPLADQAATFDAQMGARLRHAQASLERVTGQLYRSVTSVRSVPLEPALRRLPRMAREIAGELGKDVHFAISTNGIEVDKQIADVLFEPLLHLVRNAIDHGMESAPVRAAAGKTATGKLSLTASRDGDSILIVMADDGAGIDPERIREAAISRQLQDADELRTLSDSAALQLIFLPGFSTASEITNISGRGVGMDAVQYVVQQLRGSIDVASSLGQGSTFRIRLPVNSLTTRLLTVNVGGNSYGVALDQIVETARIDQAALMPVGLGVACVLRGRTIPVLSLAHLLGEDERPGSRAKLIVTQSAGEPVALRVDGFGERIDAVVRAPRGVLAAVPGVIGSALLGDGDVLLVLDLPELAS